MVKKIILLALVLAGAVQAQTSQLKSNNVLITGGTITGTTVSKVTITAPATAATLTIANGKTLTATNSLDLRGTDSTTVTFPATSSIVARTDAAQTFTGTQTFSGSLSAVGITSADTNTGRMFIGRNANAAATSEIAYMETTAPNASGMAKTWSRIATVVNDATNATEDASLSLRVMKNGTITEIVNVSENGPIITTSSSPASGAACTAGTVAWDADYIYVCTASAAWKRAALTGGY